MSFIMNVPYLVYSLLSQLFLQTFGVLKTEVFLVARFMYVERKSSSTTSVSA